MFATIRNVILLSVLGLLLHAQRLQKFPSRPRQSVSPREPVSSPLLPVLLWVLAGFIRLWREFYFWTIGDLG
jgi:hypothetical protein